MNERRLDEGQPITRQPSVGVGTPASERTGGELARHDRMLVQLEQHSPEGRGPLRSTKRLQRRVLLPLVALGVLAALVVAYGAVGVPGVILSVVLFTLFYCVGWSPEIIAAVLRRNEHKQFESEISEVMTSDRLNIDPEVAHRAGPFHDDATR